MTVVGKILVFLNLVFSLVVGAFAVLSFTAGSNHSKGFDELKARYTVVDGTAAAYKAENEKLRDNQRTFRDELVKAGVKSPELTGPAEAGDVAKRVAAMLDAKERRLAAMGKELEAAKKDAKGHSQARNVIGSANDEATEAVKRRELEVKKMRDALGTLATKNSELANKLGTEMDLRVQASLEAASLRESNKQLETTQRELMRELARARTTVARGPSAPGSVGGTGGMGSRPGRRDNPPLEAAEGSVTRVDKGGLVSISMGSDSGLEQGNTLKIFRLGTDAKYLGQIELVSVQNKTAVGQVKGRPSAPIKVGDRVGSNILGGYR